jgi:hypothetical protein
MATYPGGGIQVTSFVAVTGAADTYPTHVDILGWGGAMSVDTVTDRNNIPSARRKFGMFVTVTADPTPANNKTYQLCNTVLGGTNDTLTDNANWIEFSSGSGGSAGWELTGTTTLTGNVLIDTPNNITFQSVGTIEFFADSSNNSLVLNDGGGGISINSDSAITLDGAAFVINNLTAGTYDSILVQNSGTGIVSSLSPVPFWVNTGTTTLEGNTTVTGIAGPYDLTLLADNIAIHGDTTISLDTTDAEFILSTTPTKASMNLTLSNINENEFSIIGLLVATNSQILYIDPTSGIITRGTAGSTPAWGSITGTLASQTDLNNALKLKANTLLTTKSETGSHTLDADDLSDINDGKSVLIQGNNTGTLTVPLNATQAFPIGTMLAITGFTSVVATGGVTITSSSGSLASPGTNSTMVIRKTATNTWFLDNGLPASGSGVQNTAAANELAKSDGTDLGSSGLFSSTNGDITLGSASISGNRLIAVSSSTSDSNLELAGQGTNGKMILRPASFQTGAIILSSNREIELGGTPPSGLGSGTQAYGSIKAAQRTTAGSAGNLYLNGGDSTVTSASDGNVLLFSSPGSVTTTGARTLYVGNATTVPSASAASGVIVYSESNVLKLRDINNNINAIGIPKNKAIAFVSPTNSENATWFYTNRAITLKQVNDVVRGSSTPTIAWNIKYATARDSGSPTSAFTSDRTTTSTAGATTTTINNASIPAGSYIWITTSSVSGTVTELHISIDYNEV